LFVDIKDAFVGQSDKHQTEDEALRKTYEQQIAKMMEEAMTRAREQRDYQRKLAAQRLKDAQENEKKATEALDKAISDLHMSQYQLSEAKANLAKTKGELKRLSNKELELVSFTPRHVK
jgi:uncharacterized phage infection (PIP) family protein YhgE